MHSTPIFIWILTPCWYASACRNYDLYDSTIYNITWSFLSASFTQRKFFKRNSEIKALCIFLDSLLRANACKTLMLFLFFFSSCWYITSWAELVWNAEVASHNLHFFSLLICWKTTVAQKAEWLPFLNWG